MSHFVFISVDWLTGQEFKSGVVPYLASGRQLLDTFDWLLLRCTVQDYLLGIQSVYLVRL